MKIERIVSDYLYESSHITEDDIIRDLVNRLTGKMTIEQLKTVFNIETIDWRKEDIPNSPNAEMLMELRNKCVIKYIASINP